MFHKPPITDWSQSGLGIRFLNYLELSDRKAETMQSNLDVPPWRELIVEIDEQNEELLSGGSNESTVPETINTKNSRNLVVALVLLFANPFA